MTATKKRTSRPSGNRSKSSSKSSSSRGSSYSKSVHTPRPSQAWVPPDRRPRPVIVRPQTAPTHPKTRSAPVRRQEPQEYSWHDKLGAAVIAVIFVPLVAWVIISPYDLTEQGCETVASAEGMTVAGVLTSYVGGRGLEINAQGISQLAQAYEQGLANSVVGTQERTGEPIRNPHVPGSVLPTGTPLVICPTPDGMGIGKINGIEVQ